MARLKSTHKRSNTNKLANDPKCVCGHPSSWHSNPPDFGCPEEKNGCSCKGLTFPGEKTASALQATQVKTVAYHGTKNGEIESFNSTKWKGIAGYFTTDRQFASMCAEGGTLYEVQLTLNKAVDLRPYGSDRFALHSFVEKIGADEKLERRLAQGHPLAVENPQPIWSYLAMPAFLEYLKGLGFDGVVYEEHNTQCFVAFNPDQAKIVGKTKTACVSCECGECLTHTKTACVSCECGECLTHKSAAIVSIPDHNPPPSNIFAQKPPEEAQAGVTKPTATKPQAPVAQKAPVENDPKEVVNTDHNEKAVRAVYKINDHPIASLTAYRVISGGSEGYRVGKPQSYDPRVRRMLYEGIIVETFKSGADYLRFSTSDESLREALKKATSHWHVEYDDETGQFDVRFKENRTAAVNNREIDLPTVQKLVIGDRKSFTLTAFLGKQPIGSSVATALSANRCKALG